MHYSQLLDSDFFNWVILPILIFCARVCDVSIGTFRLLLLSRGRKYLSPFLGFVEVMIWLLAVRQIIMNLTNAACYFAFAGGFAMGNYVGILVEEKLALGVQFVRIVTSKDAGELIEFLKSKGYGVTIVDALGTSGKVNIIFTVVARAEIKKVIDIIKKYNPKAFYTIEDIRSVSEGVFPQRREFFAGSMRK